MLEINFLRQGEPTKGIELAGADVESHTYTLIFRVRVHRLKLGS